MSVEGAVVADSGGKRIDLGRVFMVSARCSGCIIRIAESDVVVAVVDAKERYRSRSCDCQVDGRAMGKR